MANLGLKVSRGKAELRLVYEDQGPVDVEVYALVNPPAAMQMLMTIIRGHRT